MIIEYSSAILDCENNNSQVKGSSSSCRKGVPKSVILHTENEEKSKELIAKAMAEMYKRMIDPV